MLLFARLASARDCFLALLGTSQESGGDSRRLAFTTTIVLLGTTCALLWLLTSVAHATQSSNLTVCPAGPPDCDYAIIQDAVDAASDGDVIMVATGLYTDIHHYPFPPGYPKPLYGSTLAQIVYISKTVAIRGGYTSPAFTEPPDPVANPVTLDARQRGRVIFVTGNISPTIEGLHITGGRADGLGGLSPKWDVGGGLYVITATAIVRNNHLFDNTTPDFGGGVGLINAPITFGDNQVFGNTAVYGGGGGLYLFHSAAVLTDNAVFRNLAQDWGGGMYIDWSNAELNKNRITTNVAGKTGGGLTIFRSDVIFSGNAIISNTATYYCGGLGISSSNATLANNVVADNSANHGGSELCMGASTCQLLHTTIARSTGGDSNGIYVTGAVHNWIYVPSVVTLTNTIMVSYTVGITVVAGNTATLESTLWGTDTWANDADWGGSGFIVTGTRNLWGDPAFVAPKIGDYHIGPASAAIDRGVSAGIGDDIDGDLRPDGCFFDIGADERMTGAPCFRVYLPLIFKNR